VFFFGFAQGSSGSANTIEEITIRGNKRTNTNFLRQLIKSHEGQALDSTQLEKDIQMLIRLPSVAHAYFQVFYSYDRYYKVFITVEENFTLIPYINFVTRGEQLWWTIGASEHNLFGRNMMLDVFYRNNGKNSYGITYRAPFLLDSKLGFATSFKEFVSDEPVYFGSETGLYEYRNRSIEWLALYQLNFYNRFEVGGSFFRETYTYLTGAETVDAKPDLLSLDKYLLKFFHQYYRVEQYYQYLDGFISNTQFQHVHAIEAGLLDFNILDYSISYYKRLGAKGNLAMRFLAGVSTNNFTPFAAYAVDNQTNLRGVGDRVKRASSQLGYSAEYRHTLWENSWLAFQAVGFTDLASFRLPGANIDSYLSSENLYLNSGAGTRIILKRIYSATLRIDYGVGLLQNNAHGLVIGLGQYF
jgi:outer membrane protein assembly factor BamA